MITLRTELSRMKCNEDQGIMTYLMKLESIQRNLKNSKAPLGDVELVRNARHAPKLGKFPTSIPIQRGK